MSLLCPCFSSRHQLWTVTPHGIQQNLSFILEHTLHFLSSSFLLCFKTSKPLSSFLTSPFFFPAAAASAATFSQKRAQPLRGKMLRKKRIMLTRRKDTSCYSLCRGSRAKVFPPADGQNPSALFLAADQTHHNMLLRAKRRSASGRKLLH